MAENIPSLDEMIERAKAVFRKEFSDTPTAVSSAPGRVNIIGEHVDYCDGFVLPMALPMVTVIAGRRIAGEQSTVMTTCENADKPRKVDIEMPNKNALVRALTREGPKWAKYIKGVIANYLGETPTFKAVIVSSVPVGGGLSSSAALEVAMYTFLDALNGPNTVEPSDKALACKKAENDYAGMPCGIMDQFISVMGKADHALLIDCRNLTSTQIPLSDSDIVVLITDSRVKHELTGTEYPTRRHQCQEAALLIKKLNLRDATLQDIEYLKSINTDENIVKRAVHVVSEVARVKQTAEALKEKNYHKVGQLMNESHDSLRDNMETSCPEIDELVETTRKVDGVLGSRITGGGFGGCTVSLVYKHAVEKVIAHIKENYKQNPIFYVCKASDGAKIIEAPQIKK